ncbi:signal peptidase I [Rhodanobacter sp. FW510-R12]|uniref:signal peptidase I n=1 Tax=unclassified Rhodanobacter TaxID=2621553 RepID=UPI0007A9A621|nr:MULTISPECIES: signal peptidase I [unclassified Rhodanobacter]KZC16111.1 signal peptidase I [Rhodanobacter sp. FW104-R8]KZC26183.1 signal peptidase I [Rhodanobacter sp. FW510-T8]KZC30007.1 signal peptidase I [Rhodanobacter sp. FW510-R10]
MHAIARFLARNKGFITFMLCMIVFRSAVADWNVVPTGSMQPTIRIGDRILVDKLAYDVRLPLTRVSLLHLADPQRGDIVVLDSRAANERLVKRVIGLPGDQVAMRGNVLFINGHTARYATDSYAGIHDDLRNPAHYEIERYGTMRHAIRLSDYRPSPASGFGPVQVPPGRYLLLGDDRDNSMDSRYFGFFPRNEIVGRARHVVASLDPDHHYLPRGERFGAPLD